MTTALWHPKSPTGCQAPGCTGKIIARNLCWRHYQQQRRTGGLIGVEREKDYDGPQPVCRIAGCGKLTPRRAYNPKYEGLCTFHRIRLKYEVPLEMEKRTDNSGPCKAEGCEHKARCLGYCNRHYQHLLRFGEVRADGGLIRERLPEKAWKKIERRLKAGEAGASLAREFGVTPAAVYLHKKKKGIQ